MTTPDRGFKVSRTIMGRKGASQDVTFSFPGVTLGQARLLADMQKFNAEQKNGLHGGSAPYSKGDFEAVITGVATPVGSLIPIMR